MCLIKPEKSSRYDNYLFRSNPPNIGEPIKKAAITIMAKATPATINLLFISKLKIIQLKSHSISIIRNKHKILIEITSL